jgi:hypothetical protein
MNDRSGEDMEVTVTSIFGAHSDQGLVKLVLGQDHVLMSPTKARQIAGFLLEAAEGAESDELFLRFFRDRVGLSREQVGALLGDFRRQREEFRVRAQPGGEPGQ